MRLRFHPAINFFSEEDLKLIHEWLSVENDDAELCEARREREVHMLREIRERERECVSTTSYASVMLIVYE